MRTVHAACLRAACGLCRFQHWRLTTFCQVQNNWFAPYLVRYNTRLRLTAQTLRVYATFLRRVNALFTRITVYCVCIQRCALDAVVHSLDKRPTRCAHLRAANDVSTFALPLALPGLPLPLRTHVLRCLPRRIALHACRCRSTYCPFPPATYRLQPRRDGRRWTYGWLCLVPCRLVLPVPVDSGHSTASQLTLRYHLALFSPHHLYHHATLPAAPRCIPRHALRCSEHTALRRR